jgi:His/Glu/Gln/Arg/opine family amino acid ABC transporter permease subunit
LGRRADRAGLAALIKTYGPFILRLPVDVYVVFITNTPALIQIYFLYYGLPEVGIRWSSEACVLIGLILNAGAYLTMILRAGFLSVREPNWKRADARTSRWCSRSATSSCRTSPSPSIRRWPISSSSILVMGTSIGALIGVDELTGTGDQPVDGQLSLAGIFHGRRRDVCGADLHRLHRDWRCSAAGHSASRRGFSDGPR